MGLAGLATGCQLALAPRAGLARSVPTAGVQEMRTFEPERLMISLTGVVTGGT